MSRSCNLECVKNKGEGEVIEFVGPVKLVLIDPPSNIYRRRIWGAAFVVLAQMMMAATTMTLLFYAFSYKSDFFTAFHVIACTIGYQLCMPSAILSLNKQNGATAPMRIEDRQFEHMFLQIFGVSLIISAMVLLFLSGKLFTFTVHCFSGLVTGAFVLLTTFIGLLLYGFFEAPEFIAKFGAFSRFMTSIHRMLGTITFILSSICFIMGICRPQFEIWIPVPQMLSFLILFCVLYTLIVVYRPIIKLMKKFF